MYKSIKIKEETWNTLRELQGKRETYDDLVSRLIKVYNVLVGVMVLYVPIPGADPMRDAIATRRDIAAQRLEGNDD